MPYSGANTSGEEPTWRNMIAMDDTKVSLDRIVEAPPA